MSKSFNRRINYHVAYNIMLVALYFVRSIVLLFPYQNRVFRIIGFGVTSYFKIYIIACNVCGSDMSRYLIITDLIVIPYIF